MFKDYSKIYLCCRYKKRDRWIEVEAFDPQEAAMEYAESYNLNDSDIVHVKGYGQFKISIYLEYQAEKI